MNMAMTLKKFEEEMAQHCAPTLSGIKAANIFTLPAKDRQDIQKIIEEYSTVLNTKGLYLEEIFDHEDQLIMVVYNKALVTQGLYHPLAQEKIKKIGYKAELTVDGIISFMRTQKNQGKGLPQQIKEYLDCTGEDGEKYAACTKEFMAKMAKGKSLMAILSEAK